jgi:hypothetical protein
MNTDTADTAAAAAAAARRHLSFTPASVRACHVSFCVSCHKELADAADHGLRIEWVMLAHEFFGDWSDISNSDVNLVPLCNRCHFEKTRQENRLSVATDKQAIFNLANRYLKLAFTPKGKRRTAGAKARTESIRKVQNIESVKRELRLAKNRLAKTNARNVDFIDTQKENIKKLQKKLARLRRVVRGTQRGR